jgi:hypothetical protein
LEFAIQLKQTALDPGLLKTDLLPEPS